MVNLTMVIIMRKYIILALVLALILGFALGFYLYKLNKINEQIAFEAEYRKMESENVIREAENIIKETSSSENKTSPNTIIIEKKYYNDCGHLTQTQEKIKEKLINKSESELQAEYIGWEIQKFTPAEVVVYKEINDFCDEHYMLKDVDGEIMVFGLDKYGNEKEVIKETGIQTKYLSEVDIENLKLGMKVYGIKELNQLLEDFE